MFGEVLNKTRKSKGIKYHEEYYGKFSRQTVQQIERE